MVERDDIENKPATALAGFKVGTTELIVDHKAVGRAQDRGTNGQCDGVALEIAKHFRVSSLHEFESLEFQPSQPNARLPQHSKTHICHTSEPDMKKILQLQRVNSELEVYPQTQGSASSIPLSHFTTLGDLEW